MQLRLGWVVSEPQFSFLAMQELWPISSALLLKFLRYCIYLDLPALRCRCRFSRYILSMFWTQNMVSNLYEKRITSQNSFCEDFVRWMKPVWTALQMWPEITPHKFLVAFIMIFFPQLKTSRLFVGLKICTYHSTKERFAKSKFHQNISWFFLALFF